MLICDRCKVAIMKDERARQCSNKAYDLPSQFLHDSCDNCYSIIVTELNKIDDYYAELRENARRIALKAWANNTTISSYERQ